MHRSLRRRMLDRQFTSPVAPTSVEPAPWQAHANVGNAISAFVALAALLFAGYQFNEAMHAQSQAIRLQTEALQSDRSSRAAELYAKYLDVAHSRPTVTKGFEADRFRFERDNRA